ncbi:YcxB family protein [Flindersiella endophytica]
METASQAVELSFTMTADDIRHGALTRLRATRSGRLARAMRWVAGILIGTALALFAVLAIAGQLDADDWRGLLPLLVALVLIPLILVLRRRVYGQIAARMGEVRAGLDDESVRIANAHSSSVNSWSAYGSFVETEQAFVLLSPDKKRIVFTVLPKRGLAAPSDAERLREILVRHLP